ncbi:hypothetical protein TNCT_532561 [Trichonephila clavata]|uniref:Uncharacterized protein n=1 Tax=Trichonephila clavata TaxID=2740835 RepID=A0A8X6HRZ0_TRICU|nr:hypothetical protein TNCT_532561 [Trichonephila clavata]
MERGSTIYATKIYRTKMMNNVQRKQLKIEDLDHLSECPRRDAFTSFRLLIGHDCLCKHLHKFGVFAQLLCHLCDLGKPMNKVYLRR